MLTVRWANRRSSTNFCQGKKGEYSVLSSVSVFTRTGPDWQRAENAVLSVSDRCALLVSNTRESGKLLSDTKSQNRSRLPVVKGGLLSHRRRLLVEGKVSKLLDFPGVYEALSFRNLFFLQLCTPGAQESC